MHKDSRYHEFEPPDRVRQALWNRDSLSYFRACTDLGLSGLEDPEMFMQGQDFLLMQIAARERRSQVVLQRTPLPPQSGPTESIVSRKVTGGQASSKGLNVYDINQVYLIFESRLPQDGRGHIPNDLIKGRLKRAKELGYNIPSYTHMNHRQLFDTYIATKRRVLGEYREHQRSDGD